MAPEPQPIIYNQPGWYVENVYQTVNNYLLPPERQPLWVDVPSLTAHFIGRDTIVADLSARLTAGGSVALSAEGKPGVGKTTLAVALAHHRDVLEHFSDGVLWAGLGPQPDLPSRLARWADALGLDISDRPTVEARAQAVRDAIGHKRLLLVIDDAWGLEAAETLRCGGPNCAHLLTSRDQRLALQFAGRSERVEDLTPADALELLRRLAPKAVAVDEKQAAGLLAAIGYLPLAVELLGGYLAAGASAHFADASRSALADLHDPARRLALATRRLGDGTGKRMSLEEVIALSIDGLAEESPEAVTAFYSLGAFAPKPANFDRTAAQAVAECDADALALLIERNLLEQDEDESLALHQTLADVACTRIPADAITRHREHYLARVNADREDWQAIEAIYPQIQYAWQQTLSDDPVTVDFVDALYTYQNLRALWSDRLTWLPVATETAKNNSDAKSQARMLNELGFVHHALGNNENGLHYYAEALSLRRQVGDRSGEATTLINISEVYSVFGENKKALEYLLTALPLWRQSGHLNGEAGTLVNMGRVYSDIGEKDKALMHLFEALLLSLQIQDWAIEAASLACIGQVYSTLGENQKALEYLLLALPLMRQQGDPAGEANTLDFIGGVYLNWGENQKALEYFEEALLLSRQIRSLDKEAMALDNIGMVYRRMGEMKKALGYYGEAVILFRHLGDRSGEAAALNNIGVVYRHMGEMEKALAFYEEALPLRRQVGDRSGEATTLSNIGATYSVLGEKEQVLGYLEKALPLFRQVRDRAGEARTLNSIGAVYFELDENEKALGHCEEALRIFRQVEDRSGEASALNNIGGVYSGLGEKKEALGYYEAALLLFRQAVDYSGEVTTLNNIGKVYSDLRENNKALEYHKQALLLSGQVGDGWGERDTRFNIARAFMDLGWLAEFEVQLEIIVQIDEAVDHPNLASDRQALEQVRAMRR